jgi:hypothetical protein
VSEEIARRVTNLGQEYPFVVSTPLRVSLRPFEEFAPANWMYLFLLLLSGERDKAISKSDKFAVLIREGRTLFHACASVGVAGLLRNARTVWFGHPRPEGSGFFLALQGLCAKLGCGKAKDGAPPGLPSKPQDDQVDVIGWRDFRDKRNANLLVFCQAATGSDWDDKSIANHVDAFKDWFAIQPYARAMSSIAIPVPAHHEVHEHPEEGFEVAVHNALHRSQKRHGVLIDRFRIVEAVLDVTADSKSAEMVGGIEKLAELRQWVTNAIAAIKQAA